MPKRTSPKLINGAEDLNNLDKLVNDKRNNKRSEAKKLRRDRHYGKLLIKVAVKEGKISDDQE
jgi:hypothetical protein